MFGSDACMSVSVKSLAQHFAPQLVPGVSLCIENQALLWKTVQS